MALPRRFIAQPAIGTAQNFVIADSGRASGSSRLSTSASFSHNSVSGSSDMPVASAREEDAVDPARACPRDDIGQHAQPHAAMSGDRREQVAIDAARPVDRIAVVKGARRRRKPPDLLGDPVHIDGEADAAVANQGEA